MKVAVIGHGYVGKAMERFLSQKYEVVIKDIGGDYSEVDQCTFGVICVPTPDKDGVCDYSIVERVISESELDIFLIKSTIPPGTTDKLAKKYKKDLVFSPEYIGEGKYPIPFWKYPHPTDMSLHDFCILGGKKSITSLMVDALAPLFGPQCRFFQTDPTTAEVIKYMENAWLATKVTFCNQFKVICDQFGVDYNTVREGWLLDGRIERSHTVVRDGFDGKCLPKDLNGIIAACAEKGYFPEFLMGVRAFNEFIHRKNRGA